MSKSKGEIRAESLPAKVNDLNDKKAHPHKENVHSTEQTHSSRISIPTIPLLCISSAFCDKASPYYPSSFIPMSLTLDGRDKITKVLQYSSRFLVWFYSSSSPSSSHSSITEMQANRFKALYKSLVESRKAYRLGRTFTEIYKMNKLLQSTSTNLFASLREIGSYFLSSYAYTDSPAGDKSSSTTKEDNSLWWKTPCTFLKLIGLAGFWLGDNVTYLTSIGFFDYYFMKNSPKNKLELEEWRNSKKTKSQFFAGRCYFAAAVVGLYANFREVLMAREKLKSCRSKMRMIAAYKHYNNLEVQERNSNIEDDNYSAEVREIKIEWEKEKVKYFQCVVSLLKVRFVSITPKTCHLFGFILPINIVLNYECIYT